MRRRNKMVIGGGIAVLVVALVVGFFQTHERQEVEVDVPPDREARVNPHLGIDRFFEALEIDVVSSPDPADASVVEGADVVLFSSGLTGYDSWHRAVTGPWLDAGGHLVVVEQSLSGDPTDSPLVDSLDLRIYDRESPEFDDELVVEYDYEPHIGFGDEVSEVLEEEVDSNFLTEGGVAGPEEPDFVALGSEDGQLLAASGRRGSGRVTVVADDAMVTNRGLEQIGVGALVADVLALDGAWPEDAVLFVGIDDGGWFAQVLRTGWPFFAGLAVLFLFGLTRARRFGPPIAAPERRRQRRSDHVRATGRFLWEHGGAEVLGDATRRALVEEVRRRRPSLPAMDHEERKQLIADELQIGVERLEELLEGPIPTNARDFRHFIEALEARRRNL